MLRCLPFREEEALTPDRLAEIVTSYVILLFSLSFHEAAHAWTALRLGDDTAAREGRVTLDPTSHIDPIGTILMPVLQVVWAGIPWLAWAKPTPVQPQYFRRGWFGRGQVLVAAAGPASNLVLAIVFAVALFLAARLGALSEIVRVILSTGVVMNVVLAVFNLVPVPPLDGSHMASWGLPRKWADSYDSLVEPYGMWLLLILVASGVLGRLIGPVIMFALDVVHALVR